MIHLKTKLKKSQKILNTYLIWSLHKNERTQKNQIREWQIERTSQNFVGPLIKQRHCNTLSLWSTQNLLELSRSLSICVNTQSAFINANSTLINTKSTLWTRNLLLSNKWEDLYTSLLGLLSHCNTLQHTATYYDTLRHTSTHCNTLQHTTTLGNLETLLSKKEVQKDPWILDRYFFDIVGTCDTLQHTATHCNTLDFSLRNRPSSSGSLLIVVTPCVGRNLVCCSVLQCVAVCCSVLQSVAVCCSVSQRVAAYVRNTLRI